MNVLVIAAHPDDEVLGCGATMAKHAAAGDKVHVLIMAEGLTARDSTRDRGARTPELGKLAQSARAAAAALGAEPPTLLEFPDNRMDSVDLLDIVKAVEETVARVKPTVVYTHHGSDLNVDHRRVHEAVVTACRPVPGQPVKTLLFFEVASSTEWQATGEAFAPNWFNDVSATMKKKLQALKCYESEMRPWPHARSLEALEALARWRGATAGCEAAEAFVLGRALN
jgi:LmbE family N-acetylglucosaminyl deacetylase